ncbi:MAG: glycosyltransferase family 39 protein, partial [Tolypothrix sp. T3-bin4]|nr:glycosyltransferase family 39 protein [Tolypothrix sp. T3-bin4]
VSAIGSIYGLGKLLVGNRGGLLLAALLALNPFYLFHSLNFRMYAPLVLWAILSAWSLLHLTYQQDNDTPKSRHVLLWNIILITSVAAGLLTFYLYAYWVITLVALVLYLDRQHWWQQCLRLGTGVLLTMPWVLWGTLKQLHNADLKRFGVTPESTNPLLTHLQNVAQTLGTHLIVGDWVTTLPLMSVIFSGCITILLLVVCSISLWQSGEQQKLVIALILGILPLLLALLIDLATKKFTLGFGYGRTMIIILPGCLLLLTLWLERASPKQWRIPIATGLLLLYLSINIGDFSLRQRSVFHSVTELVLQQPKQPILVAMNSQAWGHVMRLAYYISPKAPVMLLAQKPLELATNLEKVLKEDIERYPRVIWLDSDNPVWSRLKTDVEIQKEKQRVQQVLSSQYQLKKSQHLSGTMSLDNFTLNIYERFSKN